MTSGIKQFAGLLRISAILARYRLDDLLAATHLYRPMRLLRVLAPWTSKPEMVPLVTPTAFWHTADQTLLANLPNPGAPFSDRHM